MVFLAAFRDQNRELSQQETIMMLELIAAAILGFDHHQRTQWVANTSRQSLVSSFKYLEAI